MNPLRANILSSRLSRYALGIGAVVALVLLVDPRSVLAVLGQISLQDIALILLMSFLLVWVSVLKWQLFLKELGIYQSTVHLAKLYLQGYFVNLLVPSYIGGDVARSISAGKGGDQVHAFSATFLERYTGLVAMIVMALVGVSFATAVTPQIEVVTVMIAVAVAGASTLLFLGYASRVAVLAHAPDRVLSITAKIEAALVRGVGSKQVILKASALSLLFHVLTVVNTAVVGFVAGWENIPWLELLVVVPLILLVGAIPVSPQGLGIQEGAFLYFLCAVGASEPQALAVGIILRAKSYVLAMLGGLLWLVGTRTETKAAADVVSDF